MLWCLKQTLDGCVPSLQALVATTDSVDAFSLLQNMAPMSYDSSRLIDVACISFSSTDHAHLASLQARHRQTVLAQFAVGSLLTPATVHHVLLHHSSPLLINTLAALAGIKVVKVLCDMLACCGCGCMKYHTFWYQWKHVVAWQISGLAVYLTESTLALLCSRMAGRWMRRAGTAVVQIARGCSAVPTARPRPASWSS